jgi:hypothetical protein
LYESYLISIKKLALAFCVPSLYLSRAIHFLCRATAPAARSCLQFQVFSSVGFIHHRFRILLAGFLFFLSLSAPPDLLSNFVFLGLILALKDPLVFFSCVFLAAAVDLSLEFRVWMGAPARFPRSFLVFQVRSVFCSLVASVGRF